MGHAEAQVYQAWREEKQSAYLYRALEGLERDATRRKLFAQLGQAAEKQAQYWEAEITKMGGEPPTAYVPNSRTRLVSAMLPRLGAQRMRPILAAMKVRGMSVYGGIEAGHPAPQTVAEIGKRHRGAAAGGNLRAAVFGINDGLLSNASLILGVAGASSDQAVILLSGVAGLLAGAFSMAAGEYVSVRSQREMFEYQIGLEKQELDLYPQEEAAELAMIYAARGLPEHEAESMAQSMTRDPERALDTLAREELGLNPDQLGSPWGAALFSFASFVMGALIPLLPFLFGAHRLNLLISVLFAGCALFGVGASLSLFTGRSAVRGGLRMLGIGAVAGFATYLIGRAFGVAAS
jgi:vacuolar iron transporter family protein